MELEIVLALESVQEEAQEKAAAGYARVLELAVEIINVPAQDHELL